MTRALLIAEVKKLEDELKKAKRYFKRTKDYKVVISKDEYLGLLNFKRQMLKKALKESKRGEKQ